MSKTHLLTFVDSIIPVVTKCPPERNDDEYDCEYIRKIIYEALIDHYKVKFPLNESDMDFDDDNMVIPINDSF